MPSGTFIINFENKLDKKFIFVATDEMVFKGWQSEVLQILLWRLSVIALDLFKWQITTSWFSAGVDVPQTFFIKVSFHVNRS
jgi:hypothetical protein